MTSRRPSAGWTTSAPDAEQPAHLTRHLRRLLLRFVRIACMGDRQPAETRGREVAGTDDPLTGRDRLRLQLALVEHVGREPADVRVEAPGAVEEEPEVLRHRGAIADEMTEGGPLGAGRMGALQRLVQLLRIAEQHDDRGRLRHGDGVRERHLARLVDDERVDGRLEFRREPRAMPCRR